MPCSNWTKPGLAKNKFLKQNKNTTPCCQPAAASCVVNSDPPPSMSSSSSPKLSSPSSFMSSSSSSSSTPTKVVAGGPPATLNNHTFSKNITVCNKQRMQHPREIRRQASFIYYTMTSTRIKQPKNQNPELRIYTKTFKIGVLLTQNKTPSHP